MSNPAKTFPLIVATLTPFIALVIVLPNLISLSISEDLRLYEAGHYSVLAEQVAGPWLANVITVGAVGANIGLYSSTIIFSEVSLQFFVESRFPAARIAADRCTPTRAYPSINVALI